jgi:hypothetical protein
VKLAAPEPLADAHELADFDSGVASLARGGEMPIEALPQALDFAIRKGYLSLF